MGATQTIVNGNRHSWVSITLDADGLPIGGIKSLDYSDSLDPGTPYGTDPVPLGYTRGKYTAEFSCEMYRKEFELLKERLGVAGVGFGETAGIYNVSYLEQDLEGGEPITDTIVGRLMKVESANSDSTDASSVKLTFKVVEPILWNGVPIVAPDPTALDVAFV